MNNFITLHTDNDVEIYINTYSIIAVRSRVQKESSILYVQNMEPISVKEEAAEVITLLDKALNPSTFNSTAQSPGFSITNFPPIEFKDVK